MAEWQKDFRIAGLENDIAWYENKNEELKKKVEELEEEKRMYETEIKDLNFEKEELVYRMNDLQLKSTKYDKEISRMTELEQKHGILEENIEELYNRLTLLKLENDAHVNYIQELQIQNDKYKNMMKDICPRPCNLKKIPTYTIRRKHKYPYFIIRSRNYDEALEELKKVYPNLEEVYKVNYDHEEAYSSRRLEREFKDVDMFDDEEILLVNYTEQKFVEDLKKFYITHQNGCYTFCLIKKEEYSYYASRVQEASLKQIQRKVENKFPHSVEICTLPKIPNAVTLHNRIKEKFPGHVLGNNLKLPDTYTEEEFIREIIRLAKPSLSP